ncbi:hypothetical protein FB562_0633 [Homoserinimonas aerilata]|uniref:Uncharacterized protein n=1 Tax=Homoserinimonas aerilata TaxID=1162970 RepID=A0A542YHL9_9MICO|nr:hypothetical protein [Homoserinimonas aerilata]TQL47568.1 hypothetical protein FB562_0633 [Homoserinimonas aerilata]
MILSGCAAPGPGVTSAFCSEYEEVWNDYIEVRTSESSTSQERNDARASLLAAWDVSASDEDLSDEIRETIKLTSQNFTSAFNGERSAQASFWNGQDIVAARCDEAGTPIVFDDRDIPLFGATD